MNQKYISAVAVAAVVVLSPGLAFAHTFGAVGAGFVQGFTHPFGGLDHLLAMVAVGVWAAQMGGRALWLVPMSFVTMMALGGVAGMSGIAVPQAELWVVVSVVVLGAIVAGSWRSSVSTAIALVGVFALFHGLVHGAELPQAASPVFYAGGFVLATVSLHCIGMITRAFTNNHHGRILVRAGGAAVAAAGVVMITL